MLSQRKDKDDGYAQMCKSCACVEEGVCRVLHVCCGAVGNKAVSTGALPGIAHLGTHRQLKGRSTKSPGSFMTFTLYVWRWMRSSEYGISLTFTPVRLDIN